MPVFGTILSNATVVFSQWTTAGSDIYYTGGNVGIGVTLPSAPLEIASVGATNPHIVLSGNATGGAHISRKVTTGRLQIFGGISETDGGSVWCFGNTYVPTPAIQGSVVIKLGKAGGGGFYIDDASYNDLYILEENSSWLYQNSAGTQTLAMNTSGQLLVGTGSVASAALFEVKSTSKGFLLPRMTTAQKNAIASPVAGLMVYDTTLNKACVYTTAWETITSV